VTDAGRDRHLAHRRLRLAAGLLGGAGLVDVLAGVALLSWEPFVDVVGTGMQHLDVTGWGWARVGMGVLSVAAALAVLTDRRWASVTAVAVAGAGVVLALLLFPYQPSRALLTAALDVTAIRLLVLHDRDCPTRRRPTP
jgi:hypothetical protein